jgi:SAM-dependent methyltransferase
VDGAAAGPDGSPTGYALGDADPALDRLVSLSRVYAEATGSWLGSLGLEPGASVVDLGCGQGDVTLAAAALVGPTGTVTGVDASARPLSVARRRAAQEGAARVSFEQADVTRWLPAEPVDAVVGRLLLMHLPDPVGLVVRLREAVRPGGLIGFQDVVLGTRASQPALPLLTKFNTWLLETFRRLGRPVDMGLRLSAVFAAAGLPEPALTVGGRVERGAAADGWALIAGDVRSLLPRMEETGVVTAAEVEPATFEQRLRAQAAAADAVLVSPLLVGVSARTG